MNFFDEIPRDVELLQNLMLVLPDDDEDDGGDDDYNDHDDEDDCLVLSHCATATAANILRLTSSWIILT